MEINKATMAGVRAEYKHETVASPRKVTAPTVVSPPAVAATPKAHVPSAPRGPSVLDHLRDIPFRVARALGEKGATAAGASVGATAGAVTTFAATGNPLLAAIVGAGSAAAGALAGAFLWWLYT